MTVAFPCHTGLFFIYDTKLNTVDADEMPHIVASHLGLHCLLMFNFWKLNIYEPRSDRRDLLAIKVKSEIFKEKERAITEI